MARSAAELEAANYRETRGARCGLPFATQAVIEAGEPVTPGQGIEMSSRYGTQQCVRPLAGGGMDSFYFSGPRVAINPRVKVLMDLLKAVCAPRSKKGWSEAS